MFRSFIEKGDFRTGKAYDPKTAATYAAEVRKLQNAYSKQNHENVKFVDTSYKKVCGQVEEKRKQMPREIHDKIVQRCYSTKYTNGLAFRTARNLGLRVREITNLRKKDFNFTKKGELEKVHIHKSKGGRQRDINASNLSVEQRKAVEDTYEYFKDKTRSNDRFFTNKTQAYEKAFTRARDFISKSYTHCGVHSLRKEFAKDFFKREISKKRDVKEVKKELAQLLGHNRAEIVEHYLK
jgi:integrase